VNLCVIIVIFLSLFTIFVHKSFAMKSTTKIIFCLLLSFACGMITAQGELVRPEYGYRHYGIPDGLPTELVECVFQDSRGFLWFGTEHGVTCFDGHSFKTYLAHKSLPINKIEENEHGEIIIYGYYFVYALNTKTDELRLLHRDDNLNYSVDKSPGLPGGYSLFTKRDVQELALFRLEDDTLVEHFSHPRLAEMDFGQSIYYDLDAQLVYIPTHNQKLYVVSAIDGREQAVLDNILACRFLKQGNDLLAVGYYGVWDITPSEARLRFLFPKSIDIPAIYSDEDLAVVLDAEGNFIIRDAKSVRRLRNGQFEMIIDNVNIPNSLLFDREGNLWFTSRQGVYNFFKLDCINYKVNAQDADIVYSIVPVNHNEVYLGTGNGKLIHYKDNRFREITYPPMRGSDANGFMYRSIKIDDAIYFTTFRDILKYRNGSFRWLGIPPEIYYATSCRISDNEFAVGGWGKLFILDADGNLLRDISHVDLGRATIYTVQADDQERLWIGGHKGVCRISEADSVFFYSDNTMNSEAVDKDPTGRLWFACESHIYHTAGDTLNLFMEFPNTIIKNLCYMPDNLIVISDNTGVKIIDAITKRVVNYDYTNGNSSGEHSWNTMTKDFDGNIWLGTQGPTVLKFNPSNLMRPARTPLLYLTTAQHSENNVDMHNLEESGQLTHKNRNLHFSFTGLCYSDPYAVRYHYRLLGFQDEWSEPTKKREVTFNNLPPGNYIFQVKADAGDITTETAPVSYGFTIRPAFWQTLWFIVLAALLLGGAIVWVVLYFVNKKNRENLHRLERQKQLNQYKIQSIRLRSIPHFNANVLAGIEYHIMNFSKEEANHYLSLYSNFTNTTLRDVDLPSRSVQQEIEYIKMYLELEKMRFGDAFNYRIEIDAGVDTHIQIPNMLLHTHCENALKHGLRNKKGEKLLTISFTPLATGILICIEDNGIGREAATLSHTAGTRQGLFILGRQIELYNQTNSRKIEQRIIDLYNDDGNATGTRIEIEVPESFVYN